MATKERHLSKFIGLFWKIIKISSRHLWFFNSKRKKDLRDPKLSLLKLIRFLVLILWRKIFRLYIGLRKRWTINLHYLRQTLIRRSFWWLHLMIAYTLTSRKTSKLISITNTILKTSTRFFSMLKTIKSTSSLTSCKVNWVSTFCVLMVTIPMRKKDKINLLLNGVESWTLMTVISMFLKITN